MEELAKPIQDEIVKFATTPSFLREDIFNVKTIKEFCQKIGISESTYYYRTTNDDTIQLIVKMALNYAKKDVEDILHKLAEKAKEGDVRSQELYIKYILQLADRLDITTKGKSIKTITDEEKEKILNLLNNNGLSNNNKQ